MSTGRSFQGRSSISPLGGGCSLHFVLHKSRKNTNWKGHASPSSSGGLLSPDQREESRKHYARSPFRWWCFPHLLFEGRRVPSIQFLLFRWWCTQRSAMLKERCRMISVDPSFSSRWVSLPFFSCPFCIYFGRRKREGV